MYSTEHIQERTCALTHALESLFAGEPTASVYMAMSYVLGGMEIETPRPDREGLFRILGKGMDEYKRTASKGAL